MISRGSAVHIQYLMKPQFYEIQTENHDQVLIIMAALWLLLLQLSTWIVILLIYFTVIKGFTIFSTHSHMLRVRYIIGERI